MKSKTKAEPNAKAKAEPNAKAKAKPKKKNKIGNQGFVVLHGEKLLVAIMVLVALYIAFSGLTGYQPLTWQPQELVQAANQADEHIKNANLSAKEFDENLFIVPYDDKATWIKKDINLAAYVTDKKWEPTLFPDKIKRDTPTVFPVESLRAIPGNGPILSIDREPRRTGNAGQMGGAMGMGSDMGGMGGMMGGAGSGTKPVAKKWIVLTGLIPIKKQLSEYLNRFSDSMFTSPMIDTPQFLAYEIERSEYDPTPGAVPTWKKIDAVLKYTTELNDWAGMGAEQVDRSYLAPSMPKTLPMAYPLPPMVQKLYGEEIAYPPYIPLLSDTLVDTMEKQEEELKKLKEFTPIDTKTLIEQSSTTGFPGMGMGGGMTGGMGDMTGGMPGNMGGMPGNMGGMPGNMGGMPGNMGGMPGNMGGMPGGFGADARRGVNPTGIMGRQRYQEYVPPSLVDHYLFRYFDFDIEDEKSYVYRVRLILKNPNFNLDPKYLENEETNQVKELYSDFSAPSQAMSAGRMSRVLVKEVAAPQTKRAWQESYVKLLPIYFDMDDANEWVANDEKTVYPGMVANFKSTSCFNINSVKNQSPGGTTGSSTPGGSSGSGRQAPRRPGVENKTFDIVSDVCFLGSHGGFPVEGGAKSPAKVLLMDANGTVMLRSLGTDMDESDKYSKTPTGQRGGMGMDMSGGMGMGM